MATLTIRAQVNHTHTEGHKVAFIHFTRDLMTRLENERPWRCYAVTVVHLDR